MPPILALFLCLIFCIAVYIKDYKQDPDVSLALWIPILWMMRCASRSLSSWLYPGGYSTDTIGSPHDRIFFSILIIAGLVVLSRRKVNWKEIFAGNAWLFAFYAYMGVSILWADSTEISFKRWIKTAGDLIMVLVVMTEADPLKAMAKLFRRCFFLLIPLSVVLIKYFRHIGTLPPKYFQPNWWVGVATHKNSLGQLAMLAALLFLWNIIQKGKGEKKYIDIVYLIMIAWLLNGGGYSRSSTALLIIVGAAALYFLLRKYESKPHRMWAFISGTLVALLITWVAIEAFSGKSIDELISVAIGKGETLTGRTLLWQDLITLGMQHPYLGSGLQGFWTSSTVQHIKEIHSGIHSWGPSQSHNGYIEVFLNLGIAGLILLGLIIISAFRGTIRQCHLHYEYGRIRFVLLLSALIHNYTESSFTRPTHLIWFAFLLVAVNIRYDPSSRLTGQSKGYGSNLHGY